LFNIVRIRKNTVLIRKAKKIAILCLGVIIGISTTYAESIILQSTTSTKNSGFYDYILPLIEQDTGVTVNVVAVGTGQAIKNAERCDGDILLVHAKASEVKFVKEGFGVKRSDLMYNDFVIVGPVSDPAGIHDSNDVANALKTIAENGSLFASRGDDSGTHKAELRLWTASDTDPSKASGAWYLETGSGMGSTLNLAVGKGAYVLSDRATWINFANKQDFRIHVQGDERLFNQYGIILINPARCPLVKTKAGQAVIDWLLSKRGQTAIASYKVNGTQLFFPNGE